MHLGDCVCTAEMSGGFLQFQVVSAQYKRDTSSATKPGTALIPLTLPPPPQLPLGDLHEAVDQQANLAA